MYYPTINRKQTIRFFSDPLITLMALTLLVSFLAFTTWIVVFTESGLISTDSKIGLELLFVIPTAIYFGILLYTAIVGTNQWANIVTVTENGVWEGPFFRRRHFHPYGELPLVYCTSYVHGIIGSPEFGPERVYIVLTDQRLTNAERDNINLVPSSRRLIKIKYTKRRYARLLELLPQNLKSQMEAAFLIRLHPDNLARRRSAITSKARRRKKQRRHK